MPPTKSKLYKNGSKNPLKLQRNVQEIPLVTQASSSGIEIHNQEQFEVELCWCVQQLQKALDSGKLNNKKVQDHTKSLNVLMSSTAPVIKKRQVMRLSFGDYREKMAAEEKKISKNAVNMKFKPATTSKKTVFLKKSLFSSNIDNSFKFNFNLEEENNISEDNTNTASESDPLEPKTVNNPDKFRFVPSNNSFKFDFNVENDM